MIPHVLRAFVVVVGNVFFVQVTVKCLSRWQRRFIKLAFVRKIFVRERAFLIENFGLSEVFRRVNEPFVSRFSHDLDQRV